MRPRSLVAVGSVLAAVALAAVVLAFGLGRDPMAVSSSLVGRQAPDFRLDTLDGARTVALRDLRGQVVVVNFWASWCAECRIEHPALAAVWERYRDRGVVVLGIAYQDAVDRSLAFAEELGGDWPLLGDPGAAVARAFGLFGVPETFVIDEEGRIAERQVGVVTYDQLSGWIQPLLDGP